MLINVCLTNKKLNKMRKDDSIKDFVIKGFNKVSDSILTDGVHEHVLKYRLDNFITNPENLKLHRWAASLKSSQAFAYNIFSGSDNVEFECRYPVFDRDSQIDVKIKDISNQVVHLFEVKMFEITTKEKIQFEDKYDNPDLYKYISKEKTNAYIRFINETKSMFESQKIYGGGIKQLCSHLLGIINNLKDNENIRYKLYSFCYDNPICEEFKNDIQNYKEAACSFKSRVDKFLKDINVDSRVEYIGFVSAEEYIDKNKEIIGKENYDYVKKRYFFENK